MKKKKLLEKIIYLFFEDDTRTEEERLKSDQAFNRLVYKTLTIVFLINSVIIIYLFLRGKYEIHDTLEMVNFVLTIVFGVGALYFSGKNKIDKGLGS